MIDLYSSLISFVVVTLVSTYLVAFAYKNTKFVLKHKVSFNLMSSASLSCLYLSSFITE